MPEIEFISKVRDFIELGEIRPHQEGGNQQHDEPCGGPKTREGMRRDHRIEGTHTLRSNCGLVP